MRAFADSAEKATPLPLHITEWNIGLPGTVDCDVAIFKQPKVQSFTSGVLTLFQEESLNVTNAHQYAGVGVQISLLSPNIANTNDTSIYVNPIAWAFWAHKHLIDGQKVGTKICEDDECKTAFESAQDGKTLMAISARKGNMTYTVISNDSEESKTIDITFSNGTPAQDVHLWELSADTLTNWEIQTEKKSNDYQPTEAALTQLESLPEKTTLRAYEGRVQVELAPFSVSLIQRVE